jgi:hypothetical protein
MRNARSFSSFVMRALAVALLPALVGAPMPAAAQSTAPGTLGPTRATSAVKAAPLAPAAPSGLDDGAIEVGVEYVVDYPAGWNDLPATAPDALGLYNQLGSMGWARRFAWGNGSAWEQDWKGQYKTGGGTEHVWVDTVDLAYFAGHGNSSGFFFGVGGNTRDDQQLTYLDCRNEWGNGDAEWVGIAACNVLADANLGNWSLCMNNLHLILGFVTTMADVPHGDYFGWYIRNGYNMTQAWFRAADALQPQNKIARVLAEEQSHFYDHWWNHVGGDTYDNDYYWWDHRVGSEPARAVNVAALGGVMPIFQTPPLSLDQANVVWGQLGTAFNVTTTTALRQPLTRYPLADNPVRMSADGQLEMGNADGMFAFTNLQSLWTTPTVQGLRPMVALSPQDAAGVASAFLSQNNLLPADAQYFEVVTDTQVAAPSKGLSAVQQRAAGALADTNTAYQVIYSRILTWTPTATGNAPAAPVEFSVMGPGAKLKVYVAPTVAAGLAPAKAMAQSVIGGVGGWRSVGQAGRQPRAVQTVSILDPAQAMSLLDVLEPTVSLSYIPLDYTSRQILSSTVAYYEFPMGQGQDQLVPVYVFNVQSTLHNGDVVTSPVYIPANPLYMAPLALISPTAGLPTSVRLGQQVTFNAADASKTLASLGFDPSLTFALGNGEDDPANYLYEWFIDSADGPRAGLGRTFNYTATFAPKVGEPATGPLNRTIILKVTDLSSNRPANASSIATFQLTVDAPTFVPIMQRGQ